MGCSSSKTRELPPEVFEPTSARQQDEALKKAFLDLDLNKVESCIETLEADINAVIYGLPTIGYLTLAIMTFLYTPTTEDEYEKLKKLIHYVGTINRLKIDTPLTHNLYFRYSAGQMYLNHTEQPATDINEMRMSFKQGMRTEDMIISVINQNATHQNVVFVAEVNEYLRMLLATWSVHQRNLTKGVQPSDPNAYLFDPEKDKMEEALNCVICMERRKDVLMRPCRHLAICRDCHENPKVDTTSCPICRTPVENKEIVYSV